MNLRELILDMLLEMERERTYSNILIRNVLDKYDYLMPQEKAFIKRVTEGTLERRIQLDYIIDSCSKVPVKKMKPLIRNLLRMSVYQILFMDGVPDSAVCNEAVKLAGKRKFQSLKGFINGVLRNIARNKQRMIPQQPVVPECLKASDTNFQNAFYPDREKEPVRYLSVIYSMPEFLVDLWIGDYGVEQTERMIKAMLEIHPVTIRLKESLSDREKKELIEEIKETGVHVKKHPYLPYAYTLSHMEGIHGIPGFEEGLFTVQDVSSMLCVECAGIRAGDFVLDVCAAPGGKSTLAAQKLNGTGKVLAQDVSEDKTELILENMQRQRLTNMEIAVQDACVYEEALFKRADVLFADLPCSGLGILGKKRDIKYNVTREGLQELPLLQKKILDTVWQYVKPGGILIYSTCTIHKKENEEIVRWFLENHPYEPMDISGAMPDVPEKETAEKGYLQLLPGVHETDGFFIAGFLRTME